MASRRPAPDPDGAPPSPRLAGDVAGPPDGRPGGATSSGRQGATPACDPEGAAIGDGSADERTGRPAALLVVAGTVLLEAAVLVAAGALLVADLVRGIVDSLGVTVFLILFAWGVAAVLVACVRGLLRGRRTSRSPVMTWQAIQVAIAVSWLQVQATPAGVVTLLVAVVAGGGLLLRPVVESTTRH